MVLFIIFLINLLGNRESVRCVRNNYIFNYFLFYLGFQYYHTASDPEGILQVNEFEI